MIMAQNGAAHNGEVRIGACRIMRKLTDKIQQLLKYCPVNFHGNMSVIKNNTMFIIINIGRILQIVGLSTQRKRDNSVILSRRMGKIPGITFIFLTEQATGIAGLLRLSRFCNIPGVFFRLG